MTPVARLSLAAATAVLALAAMPLVAQQAGQAPAPPGGPGKKLLFLTHAGFYKHPSLGPAEKAVIEWGKPGGFSVTTVEGYKYDAKQLDFSFLTPRYLNQFDAIMMMTNGNLPFTSAQKEMLLNFVKSGKGFVGVHCASLTFYDYPAFGEMLGAYFLKGATNSAQRKIVVLKVEDQTHPATRMLGTTWPVWDEFYVFGRPGVPGEDVDSLFKNKIPIAFSRNRHHVLLSVDTERTDLKDTQFKAGGDYPQAWSRTYGDGRVFYSAFGHREDIWSVDPVFQAHITGALRWVLKLEQ
ncbi:MAG: ThuA domain-containing protein [Vicinamibacterales bacterium]